MRWWIVVLAGMLVIAGLAGTAGYLLGQKRGDASVVAGGADAVRERAASVAAHFREYDGGEVAGHVRLIYPGVNDDGSPDFVIVTDRVGRDFDAEAAGDRVRAFLAEQREVDFSSGYTMAVYDADGDQLRFFDTTACSRVENDPLRCDPA